MELEKWREVKSGTLIEVVWPDAFNPRYRHFVAPFIGVDSRGFIVLEVGNIDELDLYDGFPPGICSIK